MPYCCVPNCQSRTSNIIGPNVKFYRFPRNEDLQVKWLEACRRKKGELQLGHAQVCEKHFKAECIENRLTKPRSSGSQPRMMRRLKTGSIPTEALNLPRVVSRRPRHQQGKNWFSIIPSYGQLVASAKTAIEACHIKKEPVEQPQNPTQFYAITVPSTSKGVTYKMKIQEPTEVTQVRDLKKDNDFKSQEIKLLRESLRKMEKEVQGLRNQLQQQSRAIERMQEIVKKL